jgi:succinyl-CoA synthetase beta subunit
MKIHEYQAKQIFARYLVPIPKGIPCLSANAAEIAAEQIIAETGNPTVVVKAQIHAGGRGKGGGVKVVPGGPQQVFQVAKELLGMQLVTHQTGPEGRKVRRLYVEQGVRIARELYLGLVVDRGTARIAVMASTEGGVDIEDVARHRPEKILTEFIDPLTGMTAYEARKIAYALAIGQGCPSPKQTTQRFVDLLQRLATLFEREDCSLCEINPLIVTDLGNVLALDAKINLDDNALHRHPEWSDLVDTNEEDPTELEAHNAGLSYVALDGNIGCLVNGAGLAMATMDIIKHYGGSPANFLDVGGSANREAVTKAFKMILSSPKVRAIFVNIFGGIVRCDLVAQGIIEATRQLDLKVPLVVRLAGTNVELGQALLRESGLPIETASDMGDGARKIVEAIRSTAAA